MRQTTASCDKPCHRAGAKACSPIPNANGVASSPLTSLTPSCSMTLRVKEGMKGCSSAAHSSTMPAHALM